MQKALADFRICDFTGQLAGAGATKWLSAFGAEVIRIEDPVRDGRWDILRGMEPYKEGQQGLEFGGGFNNHNTDKLGITLNLRTDKAKQMLTDIIRQSDAVTENFAAGVLEKWGFGYEQLKQIKPDIVYVSNCGFGHEGPYSRYKTWGPIVQAVSGLTLTSALPNQPPAGWGYSYMDHTGGYYMAMAIMLALLHKQRTGEGQWVDLACTEAAVTLNGPSILDWTVNENPTRKQVQPSSNRSQFAQMAPHGIYPCRNEPDNDDNWVAISVRDQSDWHKFAGEVEQAWTTEFDDESYRLHNQDTLDQHMNDWCKQQNKFDIQERLRKLPIPVAAVQKPAERVDKDQTTNEFGLWPKVQHSAMGEVRVDGLPVHLSQTDWQMKRGAPCLGEHNTEVFGRLLGMSATEVEALSAEGVI